MTEPSIEALCTNDFCLFHHLLPSWLGFWPSAFRCTAFEVRRGPPGLGKDPLVTPNPWPVWCRHDAQSATCGVDAEKLARHLVFPYQDAGTSLISPSGAGGFSLKRFARMIAGATKE